MKIEKIEKQLAKKLRKYPDMFDEFQQEILDCIMEQFAEWRKLHPKRTVTAYVMKNIGNKAAQSYLHRFIHDSIKPKPKQDTE